MRGRLSKLVCPCCDPIENYKPKSLLAIHMREIADALAADAQPLGPDFERVWDDIVHTLYEA